MIEFFKKLMIKIYKTFHIAATFIGLSDITLCLKQSSIELMDFQYIFISMFVQIHINTPINIYNE